MDSSPQPIRSLSLRGEMDGTEPITDSNSKQVMIAGERRDKIKIIDVVEIFDEEEILPDSLTVVRKLSTYYGPELMLYGEKNGDQNYLLTAPGPDSYLLLWKANTDSREIRRSYSVIAEVKAKLSENSTYELCPDCGQPFKTIEHERAAAIGQCPNI